MKVTGLLALALSVSVAAACGRGAATAPGTTDDQRSATHTLVLTNGALRLDLSDFPAQPGVMWALPSVAAAPGAIVVGATQYGSLCIFEVTGEAQVQGSAVEIRLHFSERLTVCTADVRALRYTATLSVPPGTYDVTVVHDYGDRGGPLRHATVTVP